MHDIKSHFANLFRAIVRTRHRNTRYFANDAGTRSDCNHANLCALRIITYLSRDFFLVSAASATIGRLSPFFSRLFVCILSPSVMAGECNKCTHQHQLFSHLSTDPFRFKSNWYVYQPFGFYYVCIGMRCTHTFCARLGSGCCVCACASYAITHDIRQMLLVQCNCAWINLFRESIKLLLWLDNSFAI